MRPRIRARIKSDGAWAMLRNDRRDPLCDFVHGGFARYRAVAAFFVTLLGLKKPVRMPVLFR